MHGWSFTIILLVLKDLLTNFVVTCTLKDRRIAWLCFVEGNLASHLDKLSIKVEHMKCSRMISITQEIKSEDFDSNLFSLPFLRIKHRQPKALKWLPLGARQCMSS
jgi:hypothetical protein